MTMYCLLAELQNPQDPWKPDFSPRRNVVRKTKITLMDKIAHSIGIKVEPYAFQGGPAYYLMYNYIAAMEPCNFKTLNGYERALAHEIGHATGHETRLDRRSLYLGGMGQPMRAREEITAETCSYLIMHGLNKPVDVNRHAAYIREWRAIGKLTTESVKQSIEYGIEAAEYVFQKLKKAQS